MSRRRRTMPKRRRRSPSARTRCSDAPKIDHERLIEAIGGGVGQAGAGARRLAQLRSRASSRRNSTACTSAAIAACGGSRAVSISDLFLAESEAAGALVVLKLARDQQKDNELDQSFRRFLQEYEIVERIRHPQHRAPLRSGRQRRACLSGDGIFPPRGPARRACGRASRRETRCATRISDRPRARGHPRRRDPASRPEARERHAARRRHARADRLRPRQGCGARRSRSRITA